jgi:hypothetical protein
MSAACAGRPGTRRTAPADAASVARGHFLEAPGQVASFGILPGEIERSRIGRARLGQPPQSPAEIRPRRMREVVVGKFPTREQGIDKHEARHGTVAHRDGCGPVQFHYW